MNTTKQRAPTSRKSHPTKKGDAVLWLFLAPGFLGFCGFWLFPFLSSSSHVLFSSVGGVSFVGGRRVMDVWSSPSFRLALRNTLVFLLICVPANVVLPFALACLLKRGRKVRLRKETINAFALVLLFSYMMPSGAVVYFWQIVFGQQGLINAMWIANGYPPVDFLSGNLAMPTIIIIFLWKNIGYNTLLYWAGLQAIPEEYYQCIAIEGGGFIAALRHVTIIYSLPTTVVVFLLSIVNSFKSFREIYLLAGSYPSPEIYMLQQYLYNQFITLNMPSLVVASYTIVALAIVLTFFLLRAQNRLTEQF